jgi:hypothetical protein
LAPASSCAEAASPSTWLQSPSLRAIAVARLPFSQKADSVPSLIRFLVIVGVLVALGYAGMFALVNFVTPQPREMTQTIPPTRLNK